MVLHPINYVSDHHCEYYPLLLILWHAKYYPMIVNMWQSVEAICMYGNILLHTVAQSLYKLMY